jgi:hypothetical protein
VSDRPRDGVDAIRRLYFNATRATIQRDLTRAIDLFKALATDDERQHAAVYMNGLSEMRSEWAATKKVRK